MVDGIRDFQRKHLLSVDGIVGRDTANKIKGVFCDCNVLFASHFLGQLAHETGSFKYDYELITQDTANRNYGDRMGNNLPGEGFKFRGRGAIMLTGKNNYTAFSKSMNDPEILDRPNVVAEKYYFECAKWFFDTNNLWRYCTKLSDDNIRQLTRRINGGYNGLQDRIDKTKYYHNLLS